MTELLLLLGVLVLVAANGFFVAAEFALVRAREGRMEAMRDEGSARRRARAASDRPHRRVPVGLPARHHDGLARHRLPGRARDREPARGAARRGRRATAWRWRSRSRSPTWSPPRCTSRSASRCRRSTRSSHAEGTALRVARPLQLFRRRLQPADLAAQRGLERDPAAGRRRPAGGVRGGQLVRGPQAADRAQRARRQARPGRGGHALGRLPPARAAGAPGDDADPGGRHGRRLGDGRGRAAALRRLGPHAPGRDRGRTTPTASRASCTPTRSPGG